MVSTAILAASSRKQVIISPDKLAASSGKAISSLYSEDNFSAALFIASVIFSTIAASETVFAFCSSTSPATLSAFSINSKRSFSSVSLYSSIYPTRSASIFSFTSFNLSDIALDIASFASAVFILVALSVFALSPAVSLSSLSLAIFLLIGDCSTSIGVLYKLLTSLLYLSFSAEALSVLTCDATVPLSLLDSSLASLKSLLTLLSWSCSLSLKS